MDISMPVLDGIEAAQAIREHADEASILMLTGSNSRADVDRARKAGAAGYVTKDRIAAELIDAIVEIATDNGSLPWRAMISFLAVVQVLFAFVLVALVLMHSGRDAGMGGMGFTPGLAGRHAHRRAEPHPLHGRRRGALLREQHRALPLPQVGGCRATEVAARTPRAASRR